MTAARVPLGILDLVPVSSGSTVARALRNTIDLVQLAERLCYHRYWFAEHHLNPGVAGSKPELLIAMAAAATKKIRVGSGGVQSGHRTALSIVEEFGLLDAMYPGRIDLGIGRSGGRKYFKEYLEKRAAKPPSARPKVQDRFTENGILIPAPPPLGALSRSPRVTVTAELLQQEEALSADYGQLLTDILGLLRGTYRSAEDLDPHPVPGAGADVEPWVLGSSAGESAEVAGRLGLRFAASYHISPATALSGIEAYRKAFVPSVHLSEPYVAVSADVVVAPDDESAQRLAAGYGLWVRSIRRGEGAIAFPGPEESSRHTWSDEDLALVHDRTATQFVGSPETVARHLERLQEATGADELIVTTITHSHADRVRSFSLLAQEWMMHSGADSSPEQERVGTALP
jgi:alkanesulfonate monooxygenase SsuD/methylene tetrahydromethanopterin reductase-like flavin-dependent oxidoreductase (luciferase family)